jgi:hypothetical protein
MEQRILLTVIVADLTSGDDLGRHSLVWPFAPLSAGIRVR